MSVCNWPTVIKSVPTRLDHFSAAALMVTLSLLTDSLAWTSMNVQLAHITASNAALISMEDFYVPVTQGTSSTLTEETVLVTLDKNLDFLHVGNL